MALINLFLELVNTIRLRYYEAALAHMTRVNPCHEDIPSLVHMINHIRRKLP